MNEVEKLYSLAGVESDYDYFTLFDDKVHKIGRTMHLCKNELKHWLENYQKDYVAIKVIRVDKEYPPFTAEKQLELLKICFDKYEKLEKVRGLKERCIIYYRFDKNGYTEFVNCETWEETIAGLINNLWQDLTDIEKAQIKTILER